MKDNVKLFFSFFRQNTNSQLFPPPVHEPENKFALSSALLLTGITEEKQLKKAKGLLAPDMVFGSLG